MKKMLVFSVMFFMGLTMSFAQVPLNEQLTYQTVVRNAQNRLVYNQMVLYDGVDAVVDV